MSILSETWTCKLLCCLARDRKSTPKFHYTTWQSNDVDVFTGVDLERRNLLYKCRGFWTYFEDEKWRYVSWEMMYFIAFSLGYSSYQSRPRGSRAFRMSSRTIVERFWKMVVFVCLFTPKYTLLLLTHFRKTKYADWLRSIFYFYLLTFGKPARW